MTRNEDLWVIRSPKKNSYWHAKSGWVADPEDATLFMSDERDDDNLPARRNGDERWMPLSHAVRLLETQRVAARKAAASAKSAPQPAASVDADE